MKIKSKTWKIGEYCKGGVITIEIAGDIIKVIGKDWDFSTSSSRYSNQSNAKEWIRREVDSSDPDCYRRIRDFLEELTTSYYAGEILEWIEGKVTSEGMRMGYFRNVF